MWYTLSIVFIIIVSILLILIVLVQNPKGGGFASGFSGMNQFGGVAQTNKFLDRTTWTFAIILLFLSLVATMSAKPGKTQENPNDITEFIENYNYQTAPINPAQINIPENTDQNQTQPSKPENQ